MYKYASMRYHTCMPVERTYKYTPYVSTCLCLYFLYTIAIACTERTGPRRRPCNAIQTADGAADSGSSFLLESSSTRPRVFSLSLALSHTLSTRQFCQTDGQTDRPIGSYGRVIRTIATTATTTHWRKNHICAFYVPV